MVASTGSIGSEMETKVLSVHKNCRLHRRAHQEGWTKDGLLKIRDIFHESRDEGAMPVQPCFYLTVDLDESSQDVVDEMWVHLEELKRKLVKNQTLAQEALVEGLGHVAWEDQQLFVLPLRYPLQQE